MVHTLLYNWLPWIYNIIVDGTKRIERFARVIYREAYNTNTWIFLHTSDIPISTYSFMDSDLSNRSIRWRAKLYPPVFTHPSFTDSKTSHLSYLSMEVIMNDLETHDISEWVNDVKWNGPVEPTLKDILTLWACERGLCLFDQFPSIQISAITNLGTCINKGLNEP
jgi:hypothetical protein